MSLLYCFNRWKLREELNKFSGHKNHLAIIQICGTKSCQEHILKEKECFWLKSKKNNKVLNLNFDDIGAYKLIDGFSRGLSNRQARKIVKFIEKNLNCDFYISCRAGKSRSQGIVRYILDTYPDMNWKLDPSNPCITPNNWVVIQLKHAYRDLGYSEKDRIEEEYGYRVMSMKRKLTGILYKLETGQKIFTTYAAVKNSICW